jgi:hypothetical protein
MKISSSGIAGGIVTGLLLAAVVIAVRLLWETVREPEPLPLDLNGNTPSLTSPAAIGHILAIIDPVTATTPAGITRPLALKSPIFPNDKIKTAPGAKLQILFADNSIVAQGANSEMIIDAYIYRPGDKSSWCSLRFVSGVFRAITGKITDLNPERFKVETRLATIGIRGCDLAFRVAPGSETIYILELPDNRSIPFESHRHLPNGTLDPKGAVQVLELRDQGTAIQVSESGLMNTRPISLEEARRIINETTPAPPVFKSNPGRRPLSNINRPSESAPFDQPQTPPPVPTDAEKQDHAGNRVWKVPYGEHLKLEHFSFQPLQSDSPSAEFPIALYAPQFHQAPSYLSRVPEGFMDDPGQKGSVSDVKTEGRVTAYTTTTTTTTTTTSGGGGGGGEPEPPPPIFPTTTTTTSTSTSTTTTTTTTTTSTTTITFPPISESGI